MTVRSRTLQRGRNASRLPAPSVRVHAGAYRDSRRPARISDVKVVTIGGGPAGLYFALLLRKHDASHQVTVLERNGPADAYGWGVVVSEQTLENLRAADAETY